MNFERFYDFGRRWSTLMTIRIQAFVLEVLEIVVGQCQADADTEKADNK